MTIQQAQRGTATIDLVARRLIVHDEEGDTDMVVSKVRKGTQKYGRRWVIVFEEAAAELAQVRLSAAGWRVLMLALARCDARAWTDFDAGSIGAELGIDRSGASRALVQLEGIGLIERDDRRRVRLKLFLAWRGTATAYQAERRKRRGETASSRAAIRASGRSVHQPVEPDRSQAGVAEIIAGVVADFGVGSNGGAK